jgi:microsomal dipeptidase-like Zn-dependent dipeptidase
MATGGTGLFGLADTHVHFRADLGFAGRGIFGSTVGRIDEALPHCTRAHGPWGLLPTLDGVGHRVGGYPQFDGWPLHRTQAHQQAYVDWIHRAVDGGLRLAVCLAVNDELLARRAGWPFSHRGPVDDMSAIDRQLDGIRQLVTGPGQGWMEIAADPAHARQIVAADRLAIVPGVEVNALGNWYTAAQLERDAERQGRTPAQLIAEMVQDLHDRGVRHVFPLHACDNVFGSPAVFARTYDPVNYVLAGHSFQVEEAPQELGISYRLDEDEMDGGGLAERYAYRGLAGLIRRGGPPRPTNWAATPGGHINAGGLTAHGRVLLGELMRRGMVIDGDHMGHKTMDATLTMCEQIGYPVVSGHSTPREMRLGWRPSLADPGATFSRATNAAAFGTARTRNLSTENNRSPEQLARIRQLGGLVSAFLYQRDIRDSAGAVANDCAGSARSFAQILHHLYGVMGGRVSFGSDVNGVGQLPAPRFGPNGAAGIRDHDSQIVRQALGRPLRRAEVLRQERGVRYAIPPRDYRAPRFEPGDGPPMTDVERYFWEALTMWRAGVAPELADHPPWWRRSPLSRRKITHLVRGLLATHRDGLPAIQLAAFLARRQETPRPGDPARTRHLVPILTPIWRHWATMEDGLGPVPWMQQRFGPGGSELYTRGGALTRPIAGRRDFDVNVDGMAHYGLLPDFLQDLRNVGAPAAEVDALYQGAEHYIQVWERCLEKAP